MFSYSFICLCVQSFKNYMFLLIHLSICSSVHLYVCLFSCVLVYTCTFTFLFTRMRCLFFGFVRLCVYVHSLSCWKFCLHLSGYTPVSAPHFLIRTYIHVCNVCTDMGLMSVLRLLADSQPATGPTHRKGTRQSRRDRRARPEKPRVALASLSYAPKVPNHGVAPCLGDP